MAIITCSPPAWATRLSVGGLANLARSRNTCTPRGPTPPPPRSAVYTSHNVFLERPSPHSRCYTASPVVAIPPLAASHDRHVRHARWCLLGFLASYAVSCGDAAVTPFLVVPLTYLPARLSTSRKSTYTFTR